MDKEKLLATVRQICDEKNISLESVHETIEAALAAAYRKDFGEKNQNIKVEFDMGTGDSSVFDVKEVVEDMPEEEKQDEGQDAEGDSKDSNDSKDSKKSKIKKDEKIEKVKDSKDPKASKDSKTTKDATDKKENAVEVIIPVFNPKTQIQITEAKEIKKKYKLGDIIKTSLEIPDDYGRMAAQTAKQVIIQKLREAERKVLFTEFSSKEGELLIGIVQRREGSRVLVDLGNVTAIMPLEEQIRDERYYPGDRVRILILSVKETTKGPEIIVSRGHENMLRRLFELEIPEINTGVVVIKSVAREPGSRSKVAVTTDDENIDPIGSCVGQRGSRIQTIINELSGEKIDIIEWSENSSTFIEHAISPAKAKSIELNEDEKSAVILVNPDQLSLAIGKSGQNVRLAVKLTGWNLNIQDVTEGKGLDSKEAEEGKEKDDTKKEEESIEVKDEHVETEDILIKEEDVDGKKEEKEEKDVEKTEDKK